MSWGYSKKKEQAYQKTAPKKKLSAVIGSTKPQTGKQHLAMKVKHSSPRDVLMKEIRKMFPDAFIEETESGSWGSGGIWMSGEEAPEMNGLPIFNYYTGVQGGFPYNPNSAYDDFGVLKKFNKILEKHGWHTEWYDTGTMMLWKD